MASKYVAILGGGQLGDGLAKAAAKINVPTIIRAEPGDNPAIRSATKSIIAPWDDTQAFQELVTQAKAVTLEFENVPVDFVRRLEKYVPVRPGSAVLAITQDRWEEKCFFNRCGIPYATTRHITRAAAYAGINPKQDVLFHYPAILKTSRNGYDGKGQRLVHDNDEMLQAWLEFGQVDCVLEMVVEYEAEVSILIARDVFRTTERWQLVQNHHKNGILRTSVCPAPCVTPAIKEQARRISQAVADQLDFVGILALETFQTRDGLIANEMAPRPHNSGWGTVEACDVSQFEQLIRIAIGQPARKPTLIRGFRMENLIGDELQYGPIHDPPHTIVHDYGKSEVRNGRKMGHMTYLHTLT